jgi:hypothetical protein
MTGFARFVALLTFILVAGLAVAAPVRAVPSLYLIQNSGWMEPFFTDPSSPFRPFLGSLVEASHSDGEIILASFNQDGQLPGRPSPELLYRGSYDATRIRESIGRLDLPVRPNRHFTDADFSGALTHGINDSLDGRSGIVWLVTNNKNSPNNSQEVTRNTRAFAEILRSSSELPVIIAYPVRMPVHGRKYSETGLITYGIAYGDEAAIELRRLVQMPGLTQLFSDPPVQLKPLDQAPLVFTPKSSATSGVSVTLMEEGGLLIDNVPATAGAVVEIVGELKSEYYPHVIEEATIGLGWDLLDPAATDSGLASSFFPEVLHRVAPYDTLEDVHLRIAVPGTERPPGLAGLLQDKVVLDCRLAIELKQVRLSLQDTFKEKMAAITALDQLPDVFFDDRNIKVAKTNLPVRLVIHFSSLPLILTLGGGLASLLLAAGGTMLLRRDRQFAIPIQGQVQRVRLRPFESKSITSADGSTTRITGTLFGKPRIKTIPHARDG